MQKHCLIPNKVSRLRVSGQYAAAIAALLLCVFAAFASGRAGISRLVSEYASAAGSLEAGRRALELNPADPEAHYGYAVRLLEAGRTDEAGAELERAAELRPNDYFFWQELGRAREEGGNSLGAVTALRRAIALAPDYSQPHWQLGNVLLRSNETDQAFAEMRVAVKSDPALFPAFIDLAWGVSDGDTQFVLAHAQPQTDTERISLVQIFISHQKVEAGLSLLQSVAQISTEDRRALTANLISMQEFAAAQRVWLTGVPDADSAASEVLDGGFETSISSGEQGFGWQPTQNLQTIQVMLDPNEPQSGKRSLRLQYAGNFDTGMAVISQLVPLTAHARYRLIFAARTEQLVSGAMPVIVVSDAKSNQVIAQSSPLAAGTNGWQEFAVEFAAPAKSDAVAIRIQRQSCAVQPCPIFGRAWYDSFSLQKI